MNNHSNKEGTGTTSPNLMTQEGTVKIDEYDSSLAMVPYTPPPTPVENTEPEEHECFNVLSGRGKGTIGSKGNRIQLIHDVLMLDPEEYPPPFMDDKSIKGWINSYSPFDKNPFKW